jgi:hypothetical protein
MTFHSKINFDDQDDGWILKAARKQQYIMFPLSIAFLNDELKAELGMKTNKDDEEDDTKCCSPKVPIDIHKYDTGTLEEFIKWWMTLMEQINANGYEGKYDIFMFTGEHNEFVSKQYDDSKSITNKLFHFSNRLMSLINVI